ESGVRTTYRFNDKLYAELHLLHGWKNISDTDAHPALGTKIEYEPNDVWSFAYNNFIGDVEGDRRFHDFIALAELSERFKAALVYDLGSQDNDGDRSYWHGFSLQGRYQLTKKWASAARVEYYSDPDLVLARTATGDAFRASGYSADFDYEIF